MALPLSITQDPKYGAAFVCAEWPEAVQNPRSSSQVGWRRVIIQWI